MDNPNVALYDKLVGQGLYTKSYDEFRKQFSSHEKVAALFSAMQKDGHYTRSVDEFKRSFFALPVEQPDYRSIEIRDTRQVDPITGQPVPDTNRLHVKADVQPLKHIITKAKEHGIDPYTALAIAHQETMFKGEYSDNPFNLLSGGRLNPDTAGVDRVELSMQELTDKYAYAKKLGKSTEAEQLQAWNGYGKVGGGSFGGTVKKAYGIDVSQNPIDMNTNPVYGQRVIDIRDNILKANPDIRKLVEGTFGQ